MTCAAPRCWATRVHISPIGPRPNTATLPASGTSAYIVFHAPNGQLEDQADAVTSTLDTIGGQPHVIAVSDIAGGFHRSEGLELADVDAWRAEHGDLEGYPRAASITNAVPVM